MGGGRRREELYILIPLNLLNFGSKFWQRPNFSHVFDMIIKCYIYTKYQSKHKTLGILISYNNYLAPVCCKVLYFIQVCYIWQHELIKATHKEQLFQGKVISNKVHCLRKKDFITNVQQSVLFPGWMINNKWDLMTSYMLKNRSKKGTQKAPYSLNRKIMQRYDIVIWCLFNNFMRHWVARCIQPLQCNR